MHDGQQELLVKVAALETRLAAQAETLARQGELLAKAEADNVAAVRSPMIICHRIVCQGCMQRLLATQQVLQQILNKLDSQATPRASSPTSEQKRRGFRW